ncbi:MAG: hypothetical protein M2R46_00981 [Verrucomicrobia subdivision 3 bacterium]|nr:hypothetical protein [Limisphaerales bacterium]
MPENPDGDDPDDTPDEEEPEPEDPCPDRLEPRSGSYKRGDSWSTCVWAEYEHKYVWRTPHPEVMGNFLKACVLVDGCPADEFDSGVRLAEVEYVSRIATAETEYVYRAEIAFGSYLDKLLVCIIGNALDGLDAIGACADAEWNNYRNEINELIAIFEGKVFQAVITYDNTADLFIAAYGQSCS